MPIVTQFGGGGGSGSAGTVTFSSGGTTVNVMPKGSGVANTLVDSLHTDTGTTDTYTGTGGLISPAYSSNTANVASAGQLRLASADTIKFRNNANGADVSLAKTGAASSGIAADSFDVSGFGALVVPTGAVATPGIKFSGQQGLFGQGTWGLSVMWDTATTSQVFGNAGVGNLSGGYYGWSSSASNAGASADTMLSRGGAAATIQLGGANAASPISQTLQSQGSRGGTDSDVAGSSLTIRSGVGTGLGKPSPLILAGNIYGVTGSVAQTVVKRKAFHVSAKVITNNTATTIVTSAGANSSSIGVMINYTVNCSDATNTQSETGTVTISGVVNSTGTQTLAAVVKSANAQAVSSGTITVTWTAVTNGSNVDIKVASNSSLTPTVHTVHIEAINLSAINDITLA